jgi:hypothetical protein
MAVGKNVIVECDVCGFEYRRKVMKKNSYGLMVCPEDFEGGYDLKNHPQNKSPRLAETFFIKDIRPESNIDRNLDWETATTEWQDTDKYWNSI